MLEVDGMRIEDRQTSKLKSGLEPTETEVEGELWSCGRPYIVRLQTPASK